MPTAKDICSAPAHALAPVLGLYTLTAPLLRCGVSVMKAVSDGDERQVRLPGKNSFASCLAQRGLHVSESCEPGSDAPCSTEHHSAMRRLREHAAQG